MSEIDLRCAAPLLFVLGFLVLPYKGLGGDQNNSIRALKALKGDGSTVSRGQRVVHPIVDLLSKRLETLFVDKLMDRDLWNSIARRLNFTLPSEVFVNLDKFRNIVVGECMLVVFGKMTALCNLCTPGLSSPYQMVQ